MKHEVEDKLIAQGYKVRPNGEIFKYSNSAKSQKKLGQINETNVYFYGTVPYPYTKNPTFFNEILGESDVEFIPYTPKAVKEEVSHTFTLDEYYEVTKSKNQFQLFVEGETSDYTNQYDIRGVKNGALEDSTLFPYVDFKGEFVTAKIVKYNSKTGKRVKNGYSNNWFHAYPQIKEELGLDKEVKISKKVNCFFGEHLVSYSDKNVIIVESEKTAILVSLLFPELTFIATGSKTKFKNLDKTFLKGRNVFVYPDKDAHSEWLNIANENGWFCSDIINASGDDKTDIADYFGSDLGVDIAEELNGIIEGSVEFRYDSNELDFRVKDKTNDRYCIPNYQTKQLVVYIDDAKGRPFNGVNFNIFSNSFRAINSNVDFNRLMYSEGCTTQVDANEFLRRLERSFRVMKYLNKDANHIEVFADVLQHLVEVSNFTFNKYYVKEVLLPMWNSDENDVESYWTNRVWRFKGSKVTIAKEDFLKRLYEDIKASNINKYLLKIRPLVADELYIDNNDIGLPKKDKEPFVWDLIKRYNKEVLGCTTKHNYNEKLKVNEYFEYVASVTNTLENEKLYINYLTPYYTSNIVWEEKCTKLKIPTISVIHENTFVHKNIIRQYLNFESNYSTSLETKVIVSYLLDKPLELTYGREDRRIVATLKNDYETMREDVNITLNKIDEPEEYITLNEAFDYPLDLTNSALNISEEEAIQRNNNAFLYSWIKFNMGRELSTMEDLYASVNALEFIMSGGYADTKEVPNKDKEGNLKYVQTEININS